MKEIKFKQESEKHISIIGVGDKGKQHEIGHIFTPSSSGRNIRNAIQICGFTEAFDLWGCAVFKTPKIDQKGLFIRDEKGENVFQQAKDIQLKFDIETVEGTTHPCLKAEEKVFTEYTKGITLKKNGFNFRRRAFTCHTKEVDICYKCFNHPCTCEVKVTYQNPFTVKREQDLIALKVKEKKVKK